MSDDPGMETNYVVVDAAARRHSSVDMEGYSLLPDIIWTPGLDMLHSQFGKVIFSNVKECYSTNEDILCMYSITSNVEVRDDDRVAIFCVGWRKVEEVIAWVYAAKHPWPNEELSVVFEACQLPPPSTNFYQFCYLSGGEIRGASIPFIFGNKADVNAEDQQKALFRNHALIGMSTQIAQITQINIVSTGDESVHAGAAGHPQNLTLASSEYRSIVTHPGPSSDESLRANTAEADASCSEVTSSEQYVPHSQNKKQKNMNGLCLKRTYRDDDTSAASTSQGMRSAEITAPPCIASDSQDTANAQNDVTQSTDIIDLQEKIIAMERERQMFLSTMNAMSEENATLRAQLTCEIDRNQALSESLQRTEAEIDKQIHQYDLSRQNNSVVVAELEHEIDNQRLRIIELHNLVSNRDRTIAYFSQRYGAVNDHAIAMGAPLQYPPYPGYIDGQLEQEGHVDIGASSNIQRQDVRTSARLTPFYAALRKTRNYFVTFLSDKNDIENKVFAMSCMKLSLVKKLHTMKGRKDHLSRQEYQYYTALQDLRGVQNIDNRRIFDALSEVTAEQRALDKRANLEVLTIGEIKRRLEINKQNMITLRAKAIEVYSKFLDTYNNSTEHNSGAAQSEVGHIRTLYGGLDTRFDAILCSIANCASNTFIWE